jgi:hypothetical protein
MVRVPAPAAARHDMTLTFLPALLIPGLPPILDRVLLKIPIILGTLALAAVGGRWARHLGKDQATARTVERVLLFNPFLIIIGPVWGMTDTSLMALLLAGALRFEQGRHRQAGILFAVSVLIKPFPLLLALPLLALYLHRHGLGSVLRAATTGIPTVLLVCAPFVWADPYAFWRQVIGVHLRRDPQGITIWSIGGLAERSPDLVAFLSIAFIAASLLVLSAIAPRLRGAGAPLVLIMAGSAQFLLWNRVVNEQYLTMALAPLLVLWAAGTLEDRLADRAARWLPNVFALITAVRGFHFIRFIPPDVEWVLLGTRDVTMWANRIRKLFDFGYQVPETVPDTTSAIAVATLLVVLATAGWRIALAARTSPQSQAPRRARRLGTVPSAVGCVLLLLLGSVPLVAPAADLESPPRPLPEQPSVGAFYYLWWDNPAHDPFLRQPYGNWWQATQFSSLGWYTQTRGVARIHADMMRQAGIDVAILSYHSSEYERYVTFQQEADRQGLYVAPLIELNQIYDQPQHRPYAENWTSKSREYDRTQKEASYSLSNRTREAIEEYVLELKATFAERNAYRVDGRAVIFFYDSYVSYPGFRPDERAALAEALLQLKSIDELRFHFNDPTLQPNVDDLLRHYPQSDKEEVARLVEEARSLDAEAREARRRGDSDAAGQLRAEAHEKRQYANRLNNSAFINMYNHNNTQGAWPEHPREFLNLASVWREAHLYHHRLWWDTLRTNLEREIGPVFLISGDAWNEGAAYHAGIIKSIEGLHVFDGSFIYSPSFTWGVQPRDPTHQNYDRYFEMWTYRNLWLTSFARSIDRHSSFGVAPAYNDTALVVRKAIGFVIPAQRPSDPSQSTYDLSWEATLAAAPSLVIVATFNEFFEGSSIEPGFFLEGERLASYGDRYLQDTAHYRERLGNLEPPSLRVLNVVHERASRLQYVRFSETDLPHFWGLKQIAASGRVFGGGAVLSIDSRQGEHLERVERPDLILIDGGRDLIPGAADGYALHPQLLALIRQWNAEGVPVLIFGREVAADLRALVPPACAAGDPALGASVPGGEYESYRGQTVTDNDQVRPGDRLYNGGDGRLRLDREGVGDGIAVGVRCPDSAVAFTLMKPWMRIEQDSNFLEWTLPDCLDVALAALVPEVAPIAASACHAPRPAT